MLTLHGQALNQTKLKTIYYDQKHAARIVFNQEKLIHSRPLLRSLNAVNVYQINLYQHLNFMRKASNNVSPLIFNMSKQYLGKEGGGAFNESTSGGLLLHTGYSLCASLRNSILFISVYFQGLIRLLVFYKSYSLLCDYVCMYTSICIYCIHIHMHILYTVCVCV